MVISEVMTPPSEDQPDHVPLGATCQRCQTAPSVPRANTSIRPSLLRDTAGALVIRPPEGAPAGPAAAGVLPLVPEGVVRAAGEDLQPAVGVAADGDLRRDDPAAAAHPDQPLLGAVCQRCQTAPSVPRTKHSIRPSVLLPDRMVLGEDAAERGPVDQALTGARYSRRNPSMSSCVSARFVELDATVGAITASATLECARPTMWPSSCSATVSTSNAPATAPTLHDVLGVVEVDRLGQRVGDHAAAGREVGVGQDPADHRVVRVRRRAPPDADVRARTRPPPR